ncbi:MAG: recombination regulator RecX [Ignavibacterium sp.]
MSELKIKSIKSKNENTAIITLEDENIYFISKDIVYKNGLRKGDEITNEFIDELIRENQKYYIKERAYRYLSRRMHSGYELKIKLLQKNYDKKLIDEVLNELKEKNLIDDKEFAGLYIDERLRKKKIGIIKIRAELIKKGINRQIIDELLNGFETNDEMKENILLIGEKKIKQLKSRNLDNKQIKQKLFSFLISKGYDFDLIKETINKIFSQRDGYPNDEFE